MSRVKTLQELFQRYRRPGDLIFALIFLVFALFLLTQIGTETKVVKRTKWFAQPSLWPTVAIWGMVLFGALHLLSSAISPRIPGRWREVSFWMQSFEFVAYFLLYVLAVPYFGYLPSTLVFAMLLSVRVGFTSAGTLAAAAAFGISVAVIFRGFLQVKIPAGRIYEYLPDTVRAFALTYL